MRDFVEQTYWEIIIHPSAFVDEYANVLVEQTNTALEYIESSLENPFNITYKADSWIYCGFIPNADSQPTQLVLRIPTQDINPQDLITKLKTFTETLQNTLKADKELSSNANVDITNKSLGFCYHIAEKRNKDWLKIYKNSIMPIQCGQFFIHPSWIKTAHHSQYDIIIDPALAFGTGHHATTAMCLKMLETTNIKHKNMLDVGCGSGILSIVGAKLGANVYACDTDNLAIKETRKNTAQNHTSILGLWEGSVRDKPEHIPQTFDIIVANILASVVRLLHDDFISSLAKNGLLILSGILVEYKFDIISTFKDFKLLDIYQKDEWIALKLTYNQQKGQ